MTFLGNLNGSTPQMNRYPEGPGIPRLFHSERSIALIIDKTARAGFGNLRSGTVMAKDDDGFCIPYVPATVVSGELSGLGTVHILAVSGNQVRIPAGEAGKFAEDDVVRKHGDEYETDITISSIEYGVNYDTLVVDEYSDLSAGDELYLKGGDTAVYIMDGDRDTGYGKDAKGANISVVLSNATLYKNSFVNLDAGAITDLGGIVDGQFYILK